MKRTLAICLIMLMILSLAPGVFAAGRSVTANVVLEEGDGEDSVQRYVEVEDLGRGGYFIFAGHNSGWTKLQVMNNQTRSNASGTLTGLGYSDYRANKDENNNFYIENPDPNDCWYVEYDEEADDGYIIKNVGSGKYLYLSGTDPVTTSDKITTWDWTRDDATDDGTQMMVLRLHNFNESTVANSVVSWSGYYYGIYLSGKTAFNSNSPFVLLRLDDGVEEPPETYDPPTPVGPGGDEYTLVEYGRNNKLEDGASYVFSVNDMAITNAAATEGTLIGAPIEPEDGVLYEPDAQMCWDAKLVNAESGEFVFRNAATGEYLSGAHYAGRGVVPYLQAANEEDGARWVFEYQGYDMTQEDDVYLYSLRCTLVQFVTAAKYLAYDGAKFKMDDDFTGVVIYKLEGETPERPWQGDNPTEQPTQDPTQEPTQNPTDEPTEVPTEVPSEVPTEVPSEIPTEIPTEVPTDEPTVNPTDDPAFETYTVTFVDWDGTELAQVTVNEGEAAEAPENPTRENWVFTGWDKDFSEVNENTVVTAQYRKMGDANNDNDVNAGDATIALRYAVGNGDLTDLQKAVLDMNHNGDVDAGDATIILRHTVGSGIIDYGPELPVIYDEDE